MRQLILLVSLCVLGLPAVVRAENFTATLYEQGSNHGKVLFTQTQTEQREGGILKSVRRVYAYPDGREAAVEEVIYDGGRIVSYVLDHKQAEEAGRVDLSGNRLRFTYTAAGKTASDSEALPPDLIVSPTVVSYLGDRWDAVLQGKTVKARLAVLERRETVGFKFTKMGESSANGRPTILVEMKPSSFIIAALVRPIHLTFDRESRRLLEFSGRTVPKQNVDGKWQPLDVDIVYRY